MKKRNHGLGIPLGMVGYGLAGSVGTSAVSAINPALGSQVGQGLASGASMFSALASVDMAGRVLRETKKLKR